MCLKTVHHCNYKWKLRTLRIKRLAKIIVLLHFVSFAIQAMFPQQDEFLPKKQLSAPARQRKMFYIRRNCIFQAPDIQDSKWPIKILLLKIYSGSGLEYFVTYLWSLLSLLLVQSKRYKKNKPRQVWTKGLF